MDKTKIADPDSIIERSTALIAEFAAHQDWDARYRHLIELGRALPALPEDAKTADNKVSGCQSQVWLTAKLQDNKILLAADSDALIVRGLVAILLRIYQLQPPQAILTHPPEFLSQIGLDSHLSPTRANGLAQIVKQIQFYALAFQSLLDRQQNQ